METLGSETGIVFMIYNIGHFSGCFICGPLSDSWGRRWGLFTGATIIVLGTCVQASSRDHTQFILGRFLLGLGDSILTTAGPIYAAEMAHPAWRGTLTGLYNAWYFVGAVRTLVFIKMDVGTDVLDCRFLQLGQCMGPISSTRNQRGEFRYGFSWFLGVWLYSPVSGARRLQDGYVRYMYIYILSLLFPWSLDCSNNHRNSLFPTVAPRRPSASSRCIMVKEIGSRLLFCSPTRKCWKRSSSRARTRGGGTIPSFTTPPQRGGG